MPDTTTTTENPPQQNGAPPPVVDGDPTAAQQAIEVQKPKASTALAPPPSTRMTMETVAGFKALQQAAIMLSASSLVPKRYLGEPGNCFIALEMAGRMGANVLMVMQHLYVVHGAPGWSGQFAIASINASGRYTTLRYEETGRGTEDWSVRAHAIDKETGERLDGEWITVKMAKDEGWWDKKDQKGNQISKWQTMPGQMFRYRAASFWVRAYAPELLMGLKTTEELEDIGEEPDAGPASRQVLPATTAPPPPAPLQTSSVPPAPASTMTSAAEKTAAKETAAVVGQAPPAVDQDLRDLVAAISDADTIPGLIKHATKIQKYTGENRKDLEALYEGRRQQLTAAKK